MRIKELGAPQYSATTTATANDQLFRALMKMRRAPAIRSVPPTMPNRSILEGACPFDRAPSGEPRFRAGNGHCLLSRHSPKSYSDKGDPYQAHCLETTRLLREKLGWDEKKLITTFQSRFGAQEWLQPYTDETVEKICRRRREIDRRRQSGLFCRLHRDAGRDRQEGLPRPSIMPAAKSSRISLPQRQCREGMAVIEAMVRRELSGWV